MRLLPILSSLVLVASLVACDRGVAEPGTAPLAQASQSTSNNLTLRLAAPAGAPYPDAFATATIGAQFLSGTHPIFPPDQGVRLQVHGLPCRCSLGGPESREFYTVYLKTTSTPLTRLLTFNSDFLTGQGGVYVMPVPLTTPLFSETVTLEVWLEADDGIDGPSGAGVLVLQGQVSP